MAFNDREYTHDAVIKQLGLIELHSKDGSALDSGCQCIETKHLFLLEGLSEEGAGFALTEKEKRFYTDLGDFARKTRKALEEGNFSLPKGSHSLSCRSKMAACMKDLGHSNDAKAKCKAALNC